jgi:hypothetical protein
MTPYLESVKTFSTTAYKYAERRAHGRPNTAEQRLNRAVVVEAA